MGSRARLTRSRFFRTSGQRLESEGGMGGEPATIPIEDPAYWHGMPSCARHGRHPVALASTGEPIVLRYADVERLASDHRNRSNALAFVESQVDEGPPVDWWRRMLTNLNGPAHRRLRSLVNQPSRRAPPPRSVRESAG